MRAQRRDRVRPVHRHLLLVLSAKCPCHSNRALHRDRSRDCIRGVRPLHRGRCARPARRRHQRAATRSAALVILRPCDSARRDGAREDESSSGSIQTSPSRGAASSRMLSAMLVRVEDRLVGNDAPALSRRRHRRLIEEPYLGCARRAPTATPSRRNATQRGVRVVVGDFECDGDCRASSFDSAQDDTA